MAWIDRPTTACPVCGVAIRWAMAYDGRTIPIEAEPHAEGNIQMQPLAPFVHRPKVAAALRAGGVRLYRDHHTVCRMVPETKGGA